MKAAIKFMLIILLLLWPICWYPMRVCGSCAVCCVRVTFRVLGKMIRSHANDIQWRQLLSCFLLLLLLPSLNCRIFFYTRFVFLVSSFVCFVWSERKWWNIMHICAKRSDIVYHYILLYACRIASQNHFNVIALRADVTCKTGAPIFPHGDSVEMCVLWIKYQEKYQFFIYEFYAKLSCLWQMPTTYTEYEYVTNLYSIFFRCVCLFSIFRLHKHAFRRCNFGIIVRIEMSCMCCWRSHRNNCLRQFA